MVSNSFKSNERAGGAVHLAFSTMTMKGHVGVQHSRFTSVQQTTDQSSLLLRVKCLRCVENQPHKFQITVNLKVTTSPFLVLVLVHFGLL